MSLSLQQTAELHELLWRLRAADASPEQLARLERLVCEDPEVRTFYVRYVHLCADLHWNGVEKHERMNAECKMMNDELPAGPPAIDIHHSSFITHDSDLGGWLFSYAAATVITGMLVLSAWMYKVSLHGEVALAPPAPATKYIIPPQPMLVGRITREAGCRWADGQPAPLAAVSLGRKYELASGLMEISYESGAKVILQGPCIYEINSAAGGFLSLGKLTARVEKKTEGGRGKAEEESPSLQISKSSNPNSPFPLPPSSFVVRTPTAVVTDLGTEFGVEVSKEGATTSHVFLGRVSLVAVGAGGEKQGREVLLEAEQSARVEKAAEGGEPTVTVDRGRSRPEDFVRVAFAKRRRARKPAAAAGCPRAGPLVGGGRGSDPRRAVAGTRLARLVGGGQPHGRKRPPSPRQAPPKWIADAIHGRPAVRFDGEATYLTTEPFRITAEQTCFVVFAPHVQHADLRDSESLHQLFNSNSPRRVVLQIDRARGIAGKSVFARPGGRKSVPAEHGRGDQRPLASPSSGRGHLPVR